MKIGIVELLKSKKGTLCILILILSTIGMLIGRIDGTAFAAVVSVVATIYNFVQHRIDIASASNGQ